MQRKEFLKLVGYSGLAMATFPLAFAGCASTHIVRADINDKLISIPKGEFLQIKNEEIIQRKMIKVQASSIGYPIALYRQSDDQFLAILLECSHQGCELNAQDQLLICPCHGSEFDLKGAVLQGPADSPLTIYNVTTDEENIYIHI